MLKLEFSTAQIKALHYERFHHPHPRVQLKMEAVYFKSLQLPHHEIGRLCGITGNTLRAYLRDYQAGGLPQLQQLNFYRPKSKLLEHRKSLEESFQTNPPATIKQARSFIGEETGLTRSPTQVRNFLLHLGLKCRRVGMIPAKAEVEKQAAFLEQELQPRLAEAPAGRRQVFFVDAAHFVLAPFLGFLWSRARLHSRPERTATIQCVGRAGRCDQRDFSRHQPDLHHFGASLRVADPVGGGEYGAAAHRRTRQCAVSTMQVGDRARGQLRH